VKAQIRDLNALLNGGIHQALATVRNGKESAVRTALGISNGDTFQTDTIECTVETLVDREGTAESQPRLGRRNGQPRVLGKVSLPSLPRRKLSGTLDLNYRFTSLREVQAHAASVEEFWTLSPCGQIYILRKLLDQCGTCIPVSVQFCEVTASERQLWLNPISVDDEKRDLGEFRELFRTLLNRANSTWESVYLPGLIFEDRDGKRRLIGAVSFDKFGLSDRDILDLEIFWDIDSLQIGETFWSSDIDNNVLSYLWLFAHPREFTRQTKMGFETDTQWYGTPEVRRVCKEIQQNGLLGS